MEFQRLTFHTHDGLVKPTEAPSIQTVARCLMRETRYCGNSPKWWNVGLHSFVVADVLPLKLKFHGLVHDTAEAMTGDIPHDLKTNKQRAFEDLLLTRFYKSVGVALPTRTEHTAVKCADRWAVNAEVWAGYGTKCLREKYNSPGAQGIRLVTSYARQYGYAACLDIDGAAVLEFIRRFELYKGYLLV